VSPLCRLHGIRVSSLSQNGRRRARSSGRPPAPASAVRTPDSPMAGLCPHGASLDATRASSMPPAWARPPRPLEPRPSRMASRLCQRMTVR
jgi:hypothetical protein